jgi:hypothetical protein
VPIPKQLVFRWLQNERSERVVMSAISHHDTPGPRHTSQTDGKTFPSDFWV